MARLVQFSEASGTRGVQRIAEIKYLLSCSWTTSSLFVHRFGAFAHHIDCFGLLGGLGAEVHNHESSIQRNSWGPLYGLGGAGPRSTGGPAAGQVPLLRGTGRKGGATHA